MFESSEQLIKNKNIILCYNYRIFNGKKIKEFLLKNIFLNLKIIEKISYDILFEYISNADFFTFIKKHAKYIKVKTSDSFQLVYGFNIPMVIKKNLLKNMDLIIQITLFTTTQYKIFLII